MVVGGVGGVGGLSVEATPKRGGLNDVFKSRRVPSLEYSTNKYYKSEILYGLMDIFLLFMQKQLIGFLLNFPVQIIIII